MLWSVKETKAKIEKKSPNFQFTSKNWVNMGLIIVTSALCASFSVGDLGLSFSVASRFFTFSLFNFTAFLEF